MMNSAFIQRAQPMTRKPHRAGLSLLEVVLAFVILAMSMVSIGQLMIMGAQRSTTVVEQARGQQYATSLLDAVAAGLVPMESTTGATIETDPEWEYALDVQVQPIGGAGNIELMTVVATVQLRDQAFFQSGGEAQALKPSTVSLTRWMLDPQQVAMRVEAAYDLDQQIIQAMIDAENEAAAEGGGDDGGGQ